MKRAWPLGLVLLLALAWFLRPDRPETVPSPSRPSALPADSPTIDPPRGEAGRLDTEAVPRAPSPAPARDEAMESQSHAPRSLVWLAEHQNEDGSFGDVVTTVGGRAVDRAGITGVVLLSFLGAGYSHLSRDEMGKVVAGDVIRNALLWLMSDQNEHGLFRTCRGGSLDQALATLALCEAYGMTASNLMKDPAQHALDGLLALQLQDGSWGDPTSTAWAAETLVSALMSEQQVPKKPVETLKAWYDAQAAGSDPAELSVRILLDRAKKGPRLDTLARQLSALPPDWSRPDFSYWYHGSLSTFSYDGPRGPVWSAWGEPLKQTLLSSREKDGSWKGATLSHSLVQTSLGTLALEVYYRYANVPGLAPGAKE